MLKYLTIILFLCPLRPFAQNPACVPLITITENKNSICAGTAVSFHATITHKGTNEAYQWKRNNANVGTSQPDYSASDLHDGDVITCMYSTRTSCAVDTTVVSNAIEVHVIDDIIPTVSIANNDSLVCEGETTVFTATAYYGNATPSFQWFVNGTAVGTNSPVFTTSSITNGSRIECTLTISIPSCGITRSSTSRMNIYVYPMIHPAINIKASKSNICRGEEVTFTATANGGPSPRLEWEINGKPTGNTGPQFRPDSLKDGDTISCTITINQDSRCHTSTSAPSNKIVVRVRDYQNPDFMISSPNLSACAGSPLTFTSTAQNAGDYKFYQWQVNGNAAGSNSSVFSDRHLANGDRVSCTLTTDIPGCDLTATLVSNSETVTIKDTPVIALSPPEITVLWGETAQLNATASGTVQLVSWAPANAVRTPGALTTTTLPLTKNILFSITVTDSNGCTSSKVLAVKVLQQLHMPSAFTPNRDGKNDVFRIPPDASISLKEFTVFDRWGNIVFRTSDRAKGWDGVYRGHQLNPGTYIYMIRGSFLNKEIIVKGTVALIR